MIPPRNLIFKYQMEKFIIKLLYSDERINPISKERKSSQPPKKPSVVLVISNKCCTRRPYPKRGSRFARSPSRQGKPQGASPRSTCLKISA